MAISRSLMNRQLQADGGIMQVAPREKFGLGSDIKKFARKIIPNEIADIAVKAAPFVAPFNPAVAAAMSGLGTFDQTGSIGDSLKGGALTYGLGQGARYLGGAGFQGNPFAADGGAFRGGLEGFKGGFSSPLGNQTGFKLGKPVQEIKPISGNEIGSQFTEPTFGAGDAIGGEGLTGGGEIISSSTATTPGSAMDSFKSIVSFDTSAGQKTDAAFDLLKRGSKALFTKPGPDGTPILDKAAVLGAVTAAASYAEALALAEDTGVEITEEEYDEAKKADKKEEYASYLQNFFGGKKDGGRIGFESGANEMIKTQLLEEIMPDTSTEDMIMIMTEDGPKMVLRSQVPFMSMMKDTSSVLGGTGPKGLGEEFRANGGRIGFKKGSPEETSEIGIMAIDVEAGDDEEENDLMAGITFSRPEKSYLFRRLGGSGGSDRSYTMPNLYRILNNPNKYPEDAAILKEIAIMGLGEGQKDGGRIGLKDGTDAIRDIDFLLEGQDEFSMQEFGKKVSELNSAERKELADKIYSYELKFKDGGRIGYKGGANRVSELLILRDELIGKGEDVSDIEAEIFQLTGKTFKSVGGISDIPTGKMRKNNAGVVERDYRDEGGFVPVGIKERADDVPAMLSKNEFVMTADAVRGIGNGSVEEGSKKLYNTMKQAEKVGKA